MKIVAILPQIGQRMNYAEFNDRVLSVKVAQAGHKSRSSGGLSPNYSFEVASVELEPTAGEAGKTPDSVKVTPKTAPAEPGFDNSIPAALLATVLKVGGEIGGKWINPNESYELEKEESDKLEVAIKDVLDYYSIGKMHPVLALFLCVGTIYGPKFALAYFQSKDRNGGGGSSPNPNITKLERPLAAAQANNKLNREEFREFVAKELAAGKTKRSLLERAGFYRNEALAIINEVAGSISSNVTSNVTSNDVEMSNEVKYATS